MKKETLYNLYVEQKKSMRDIALILGFGETTVHKYMKKFGIQRREKSEAMKLKAKTNEHRQNLARARYEKGINVGALNPRWKGGIARKTNDRNQPGLVYWRNSVKRRDDFKCQVCGIDGRIECCSCGRKPILHVHHIFPWASFPSLRFEISNGMTVCDKCHHSLKGKSGELLGSPVKDNQQPSYQISKG